MGLADQFHRWRGHRRRSPTASSFSNARDWLAGSCTGSESGDAWIRMILRFPNRPIADWLRLKRLPGRFQWFCSLDPKIVVVERENRSPEPTFPKCSAV